MAETKIQYKANTPGEYFGTLTQAFVTIWHFHLKTPKYAAHIALNDFYDDLIDPTDALIEAYQGTVGHKVEGYVNIIHEEDFVCPYDYLHALKDMLMAHDDMFSQSELCSRLDDVFSLIDSTLYKLKELDATPGECPQPIQPVQPTTDAGTAGTADAFDIQVQPFDQYIAQNPVSGPAIPEEY